MVINQGDVYWLRLENPADVEQSVPHPHVVIQDNGLNHSPLATVVICALTSNIKRVSIPGNVLLEVGEANLSRHSVVEVSKIFTVDKTQLGDYIGTVSEERVAQILAGIQFLRNSFFDRS